MIGTVLYKHNYVTVFATVGMAKLRVRISKEMILWKTYTGHHNKNTIFTRSGLKMLN